MTMIKSLPYGEFRRFLAEFGYTETRFTSAEINHHPEAGRLFFRRYRDDEEVDLRDLVSTRKFLDSWGLLDAAEFETRLHHSSNPV